MTYLLKTIYNNKSIKSIEPTKQIDKITDNWEDLDGEESLSLGVDFEKLQIERTAEIKKSLLIALNTHVLFNIGLEILETSGDSDKQNYLNVALKEDFTMVLDFATLNETANRNFEFAFSWNNYKEHMRCM